MPDAHIEVLSIAQELEPTPDGRRQLLHEFLFFPEFNNYGDRLNRLQSSSRPLAKAAAGRASLDDLHRRQIPEGMVTSWLMLSVEPTRRSGVAWREPVELGLPVLTWTHGNAAAIGYVPALGIEVVDSKRDRLWDLLESHARFAVRRRGLAKSLLELAYLQRGRELHVERLAWNPVPDSTKKRYERLYGDEGEKQKSVLKEVATRLRPSAMPVAYEREADIQRLLLLLTGRKPSSVLMVGPPGSGKSALFKELVRLKSELGLKDRPFWQTSGGRIVAGQTGFGMWQKRCGEIVAEAKKEKAVLFLGNLFELMQVGQSTATTESIGAFLRPAMIRGDLLAVVECTSEQLHAIETHNPKILDAFRQLPVSEPDPKTGRRILDRIAGEAKREQARYDETAVARLDALHRRYSTYSAYPGRAAWFMRNLRSEGDPKRTVGEREVIDSFSKETGLPLLLLDDAVRFDAEAVAEWMRERVLAQDGATTLVVDTIATIKARLSRPKKPLASFMFIGPTGVGKTELAKTLAEFLYGSAERLVRFDMSEFSAPWAAQRLVSSAFDGGEGLLTAAVREEPFSVILLDEFEKAAPEVYDLFLQVLGEGRLTDAAGRLADFTNAVIIMTSNLGAASYGKGALGFDAGSTGEADKAVRHFEDAVKAAVRPEFFNRIDKIVPFLPLGRASVAAIAERELGLAAERDGLGGRHLRLEVDPKLMDATIDAGCDPRYGARPMKRAIEQRLLMPLAGFLNRSPRRDGVVTLKSGKGGKAKAKFQPDSADDGEAMEKARRSQAARAEEAAENRRDLRLLSDSAIVQELRSEAFRIEAMKTHEREARRRKTKGRKADRMAIHVPFDKKSEKRLELLNGLFSRIDKGLEEAVAEEERQLLALVRREAEPETAPLLEEYESLLVDTYAAYENAGETITLFLGAEHNGWMSELALAYIAIMKAKGARVRGGCFLRDPPNALRTVEENEVVGVKAEILTGAALEKRIRELGDETGAVGLQFDRADAPLWLRQESGLHITEVLASDKRRCLLEVVEEPLEGLRVELAKIERAPSLKKFAIRRQFDANRGRWRDTHLATKGRGAFSQELLEELLGETLVKAAKEAL